MQHYGQRCGEEAGVVRRDLRTATDLGKAEDASYNRDNAKRDQSGGYEPFRFGGGSHMIYITP